MSAPELVQVKTLWLPVSHFVFVPHTEQEYQEIVALVDALVDEIGEDENHPLASLLEVLGALIERYEDEHIPELTPPER
ncbi:MAG TPA: hypothetical protein VFD70_09930 [Anaerolineae bacterium]|nr:hypothetical protein [Anaerolineae bacterium]